MNQLNNKYNDQPVLRQLMDQSTLFQHWSYNDKALLAQRSKECYWSTDEALFERGELGKYLYFIVAGSIKGMVLTEDGEEAIIGIGGSGQILGGLSIIDNQPHPHSAIALEPVHAICFDGHYIRRVLEANPQLYREACLLLCQRLRATFSFMEECLLSSLEKRVFNRLKHIALETGTPQDEGYLIGAPISQDMLAAMFGVTRQTLNKTMGELKKMGAIRKIKSQYWINNISI